MAKPKSKRNAASRNARKPKPRAGKSSPAKTTKKNAAPASLAQRAREPRTKTEACLALLVRPEGTSLAELQHVTGWQAHSVRGFLSGTVKKMPGLALSSEKVPGESRRYRVTRAPP